MSEELKKVWEALNKYGIYTMEDFEKAYKKYGKIDIGRFTGIKLRNKKGEL